MKRRIIELSANNRQERIVLPVNPKEIEFSGEQLNQKITLLNVGEYNLRGNRGLLKGPISSFFPSERSPFYHYADRSPQEYVGLLQKWKESGDPIRMIDTDLGINLMMDIEKLSIRQSEGDGDIYYTLELCEARTLNVPAVKVTATVQSSGLKARPNTQAPPKTYTVKSGDTLWGIAKKMYGDGAQYMKIYNASKAVVGSNPNLIKPGQVLTVP